MSTLTITGIQTTLHWEDKDANLQSFEKKILSISQPTEIIVLPEMFSTGFSMQPEKLAETMDGPAVQWMKKISAKKKVIVTGSLIIKDTAALSGRRSVGSEAYFNRLIWMLPNGQYGTYDKRHLFDYGNEDQHYSSGTKRLVASVKGWKINLLVCYDLRFPIWSRQSPLALRRGGRGLRPTILNMTFLSTLPTGPKEEMLRGKLCYKQGRLKTSATLLALTEWVKMAIKFIILVTAW